MAHSRIVSLSDIILYRGFFKSMRQSSIGSTQIVNIGVLSFDSIIAFKSERSSRSILFPVIFNVLKIFIISPLGCRIKRFYPHTHNS